MQTLSPGVFQVTVQEVVTIDVKATGAQTLFGVNYSIFGDGHPIQKGQLAKITMDKSRAMDPSFLPNAKATVLSLLFSFDSASGGRYDLTLTGSGGGASYDDFANQHGKIPAQIPYTFHIV